MKKLHVAFIIAGIVILIVTTSWGLLYIYASQNRIPDGTTVGSVHIGGLGTEQALDKLEVAWNELEKLQARITLNDTKENSRQWALRQLGFAVERENIRNRILALHEGNLAEKITYRYHFPRQIPVQLAEGVKTFEKTIRSQWGWLEYNEPVNARRSITAADQIVYEPHQDGHRLELDKLFAQVSGWANQVMQGQAGGELRSFRLQIAAVHPAITLDYLKGQGVERKISSFSTEFARSSEGRAYNVTSTAKILNDWELAPGELFDYSKVITAAQEHYGFREAPVIVNGQLVPGIGGGICQVSSTLYNAALLAGLEIVERRNHSRAVPYLPMGRDATFAEGYLNFRFRNSTAHHLIIRTEVYNRTLTVKLFGSIPKTTRYTIETKLVKTITPPVKEIVSNAAGRGGRVVLKQGSTGYVVKVYRTRLEQDQKMEQELISTDTYPAQPTIIGVSRRTDVRPDEEPLDSPNVLGPELETHPIVEDGILLPHHP
ncbi:VanW family protein [Paenibacillus sp. GCM10012307]|uniref:VanW family protein n=1 Tax=Paenibacillus roseus TaxID=2798579 RepID=A0A934J1E1_9BACL|nr:VanW family protein [Paenibacillus roseus]MBJ6360990.1 VanW family protein [Paenibacillus roseus]